LLKLLQYNGRGPLEEAHGKKVNEKATFQFINVTGEIMGIFNKTFPVTEIDVSKYATGVYLLKINTHEGEISLKFIKE